MVFTHVPAACSDGARVYDNFAIIYYDCHSPANASLFSWCFLYDWNRCLIPFSSPPRFPSSIPASSDTARTDPIDRSLYY